MTSMRRCRLASAKASSRCSIHSISRTNCMTANLLPRRKWRQAFFRIGAQARRCRVETADGQTAQPVDFLLLGCGDEAREMLQRIPGGDAETRRQVVAAFTAQGLEYQQWVSTVCFY